MTDNFTNWYTAAVYDTNDIYQYTTKDHIIGDNRKTLCGRIDTSNHFPGTATYNTGTTGDRCERCMQADAKREAAVDAANAAAKKAIEMQDADKYIICHDVHFVHTDRWGNEQDYPDGYEVQTMWQLRRVTADGGSDWLDCCISLKNAKSGLDPANVTIDRTQQAPAFAR